MLLIFLRLLTLSDGVAAFIAAISAWRRTDSSGRRPDFFIAAAFALFTYAMGSLMSGYNSLANGPTDCFSPGFVYWALGFSLMRTIGIWTFAMVTMNGKPGFIRRAVFAIVDRFRGKAVEQPHSGDVPLDYWQNFFKERNETIREIVRDELAKHDKETGRHSRPPR